MVRFDEEPELRPQPSDEEWFSEADPDGDIEIWRPARTQKSPNEETTDELEEAEELDGGVAVVPSVFA